jgi:hypothetical protein
MTPSADAEQQFTLPVSWVCAHTVSTHLQLLRPLLRREADRKLTQQRQKPMLIVFHTQDQSRDVAECEQRF